MRYAGALAIIAMLAGCGSTIPQHVPVQESFGSTETFSRMFDASPAQTCEAARRALLSQGYVVQSTVDEQLDARKRFQPADETHVQIEFHVECAPISRGQPMRSSMA